MNARLRRQVVQRCPNCEAKYDVGIYVSGQKVRCRRCGIKFEVIRSGTRFQSDVENPEKHQKNDPPPRSAHKQQRIATGDIPAGTNLSGYVVDEPLGRGAMGTVYRGRQVSLERPVAIKVMSADLVEQREFVLRFRREAAALASLSHENVVSIIDQGQLEHWWYFVMEFVEGPTLRKVMSQQGLRMSVALNLAAQIARGLDYAHSKGIVHRDLKPENVLLATRSRGSYLAKICDFGLADLLDSDRSFVNLTGSRISMGTVNYMAPEQRQDAGRVDQRADVFSFGVMLYELFTGELPLGRFSKPSAKNPYLDKRLDDMILKALEPDARRRFTCVRDMADTIVSLQR